MREIDGVTFKYDIGDEVLIRKEFIIKELKANSDYAQNIYIEDKVGKIIKYYDIYNFKDLTEPWYGIQFDLENSKGMVSILYEMMGNKVMYNLSRYFPESCLTLIFGNNIINF